MSHRRAGRDCPALFTLVDNLRTAIARIFLVVLLMAILDRPEDLDVAPLDDSSQDGRLGADAGDAVLLPRPTAHAFGRGELERRGVFLGEVRARWGASRIDARDAAASSSSSVAPSSLEEPTNSLDACACSSRLPTNASSVSRIGSGVS